MLWCARGDGVPQHLTLMAYVSGAEWKASTMRQACENGPQIERERKGCGERYIARNNCAAFWKDWRSISTSHKEYRTIGNTKGKKAVIRRAYVYVRVNMEDPKEFSGRSLRTAPGVASNRGREQSGGRSMPPPSGECCWRSDCREAGLIARILE